MKQQTAQEHLLHLLGIPSVNAKDDEGKAAEYLAEFFRAAGIEAKVWRIDATHANVTAFLKGRGAAAPTVWNGHLDTVAYGDRNEWNSDPAVPVIRNGRIYARGASDMKSGLAAMTWALTELAHNGTAPAGDITFLGTCDEEHSGRGASAIVAAGLLPKVRNILVGEPTGLNIGTAQKGCLWLSIEARGKTSHGAYPERGVNAVDCGYAVAEGIHTYVTSHTHPLLGSATAQITEIEGGIAPNMTPDRCRILMDIRMTPELSAEAVTAEAEELIREKTAETGGRFTAALSVKNHRLAVETASEDPFAEQVRSSIRANGFEPKDIGINYFTDASIFLRDAPEAKALLFGPGEPELCHQPDEYVELEKYEKAIQILQDLACKG